MVLLVVPINLIFHVENVHDIQQKTNRKVRTTLRGVIRSYSSDTIISRNFVFYVLLRKIALAPILIYVRFYPLIQIGIIINLILNLLVIVLSMNIFKTPFTTIVEVASELGLLLCAGIELVMIGSTFFSDGEIDF